MPAARSSPTLSRPHVESGADWDVVVRLTAEACLHRSEGRERLAAKILQETLPAAIRSWSMACGHSAAACRDSLKAMFSRVREQIMVASIQRRMLLADIARGSPAPTGPAVPAPAAAAQVILRERIRFDDVSGMLDALAGAEADCAAARPPARAGRRPFALAL